MPKLIGNLGIPRDSKKGIIGNPRDSKKGIIGALGIPRDSKKGIIGTLGITSKISSLSSLGSLLKGLIKGPIRL